MATVRALCALSLFVLSSARLIGLRRLDLAESVGNCHPALFAQLGSPILHRFEDCVKGKENSTDLTVAGASVGIEAECWCQTNMTAFMVDHGCADHPKWRWLTNLKCHHDCQGAEVEECLKDCPALCYEKGYFLPGCEDKCSRRQCTDHLLCIVEDSDNATKAGFRNRTCDERALQQSKVLQKFSTCLAESPYRTNWDRLASRDHCACKAGLHDGLQANSCCEVNAEGQAGSIFETLCNVDCSVDCESTEATQCMQQCADKCVEITPGFATQACWNTCIKSSAPCHKYKVCEPDRRNFSYFCNDGSSPDLATGCCQSLRGGHTCPTWCQQDLVSSVGPVCQCGGCPATREETHELMNLTITRYFQKYCWLELNAIAHSVGLRRPTEQMAELVSSQIADIAHAISDYGSYFDANLLQEIYNITMQWNAKILAAAENTVVQIEVQELAFRRRANNAFVTLITAAALGLCAMSLGVFGLRRLRRDRERSPPPCNDPDLVVGRPLGTDVHVPEGEAGMKPVDGVLLGRVQRATELKMPSEEKDAI